MIRKKMKVIAAASVLALGLLSPGTHMWVAGTETAAEAEILLEVEAPDTEAAADETESIPEETALAVETEAESETESEAAIAEALAAETETAAAAETAIEAETVIETETPAESEETETEISETEEVTETDEPMLLGQTAAYSDIESAALVVRDGMKNRRNTVTLTYVSDGTLSQSAAVSIGKKIYEAAIAHTGVPDEGDYIKWHRAVAQKVNVQDLETDGTSTVFTLVFSFEYTSDLDEEAAVDQAAAEVMETLALDQYDTDYEKVYAIYDYICSNVAYWEYTAAESAYYILSHSAYAAFVNNEAVCQGYALMFYRLALTAGIDNRLVSGYAADTGVAHGWNIVKIGDKYYNVDATWDAGKEAYDYFLLGSERFEDTNHVIHSNYTTETFEAAYPLGLTYVFPNGEAHSHIISGWISDGSGLEDTHHSWCYLCGETDETEPHTWDEGQVVTFYLSENETIDDIDTDELLAAGEDDEETIREVTARVYTCEKCGEMHIEEVSAEDPEPVGKDAEETEVQETETETEETVFGETEETEETEEETYILTPGQEPPADQGDDEPVLLEQKTPRDLPKTRASAGEPVDTSDPTSFGADIFLMTSMIGVMAICLPLLRKKRKLHH